MSVVVCPSLSFPNLYWWSFAVSASQLLLDEKEHFEKMGFRNRYMVSGADGALVLSVPLAGGRQQRKPMEEVLIDNKTNWQLQHWRTMTSVYNRSPYFEFYAPEFEVLYSTRFERLVDFNRAGILLLARLAGMNLSLSFPGQYLPHYPDEYADIRGAFRARDYAMKPGLPMYHQTFEDRTGFLPNLSLADLLFAEGNNTSRLLKAVKV